MKYTHILLDFNMPGKGGIEAAKEISDYLNIICKKDKLP
jgi:CheY-like chemotaxis protein